MECEFCEIDGRGQHAPRCPVALETRLALFETALRDYVQWFDCPAREYGGLAQRDWLTHVRSLLSEQDST